MKILKKGGGVVEKRGEDEAKSMPHAPVTMIKRKRTNTDLQNITQKTKDRVTRTLTKIRG